MKTTSSYYEILSVNREASSNQIKQAYRQLVMQHHPDKGGNKEQFQRINAAYQVLNDSVSRKEYDHILSQQSYPSESHATQSASQGEQKTNEYKFPADEYFHRIVYILNNLTSYTQISESLFQIKLVLGNIRIRWTPNDYLKISSIITIQLMNIVINEANQMVQNYHAYIEVDEKGLKRSLQKLKQIGNDLEMDNETTNIYLKNKNDLESALHNCSSKKFNSITKTTTIVAIISIILFIIFNGGIYMLFPFIVLIGVTYYILYFIIGVALSIIHALYWNIKTLFN